MKKLLCFLLCAIAIAFTGCNSKAPLNLSYDMLDEPANLDPQTASDLASLTVINNTFKGLFSLDAEANPQNALAEKYTVSDNKLSYVFNLREDAVWNDYNEKTTDPKVTAYDFQFAFKRLLNKETNSPYSSLYFCIKNAQAVYNGEVHENLLGVRALDEFTLKIELEYANDNLLYLLSAVCAMPCNEEFFKNTRGRYGLGDDTIIANGPFVISAWRHNQSVTLRKNNAYYNAEAVEPNSIKLWINSGAEKNSTIQRLIDEKTLAGFVDGFDIEKLASLSVNTEPNQSSTWGMIFNQGNKKLANKNLRYAISGVFDRSTYSSRLHESLSVANAIIPHGALLGSKTYREHAGEDLTMQYDPELAYEHYKVALEELNIGSLGSFTVLTPEGDGSEHAEYFSYVSQVLQRELGIFLNIDEVDKSTYEKRLKSGDFDCAIVNLKLVNNSVRSIFAQFMTGNPQNYISYSNEQVDSLLAEAATQTDSSFVNDIYAKTEKLLLEDAIFIPMYYKTDYFVVSQEISGLVYHGQTGLISFEGVVRSKKGI